MATAYEEMRAREAAGRRAAAGLSSTSGGIGLPPDPDQHTNNRPPTKKPGPAVDPNAAARAEANAAMARAGNRYASQAANLDPQIASLTHALTVAFKQSLDQNLGDLDALLAEQFDLLKEGGTERAAEFVNSAKDTSKATAAKQESSFSNLVRERQDSLTGILEQGAGETDALRAMVMSARNWHGNAQEANRAYFDTMQSINQGITDLNVDTRTALSNTHNQTETERERLWQDYYNRRSESFTQLGNLYTQQADYRDMAKEQKVGEGGGGVKTQAEKAYMDAAKEAGLSYTRQGLPSWIKGYEAQKRLDTKVGNTNLASAVTVEPYGKAEGATLRSWA